MLVCLNHHARQYVQAIGEQLGLKEDVASKNLQLLAVGGFLTSKRVGRYLYYSPVESDELLRSVLAGIRKAKGETDSVMRTLTALTHERRIVMVALLSNEAMEKERLCSSAKISGLAAGRHLDKLVRRGWVNVNEARHSLFVPKTSLEKELVSAVKKSITLAQV